jgi:hypothetical protein
MEQDDPTATPIVRDSDKLGPACLVFVVFVMSQTVGHDDVRRFLTILKKISEVNKSLMIDGRRHMWMC